MTPSWIELRKTDHDTVADTVRANAGRRGEAGIAHPISCRTDAIPGPQTPEREPGPRRGAVGRSWSGSRRGAATASRLCLDTKRKEMSQ